ncbi:MAG: glycosyltransferase family 39 protein [Candidatus Omnitrophica bacterium]|nr:glycosyltransferase family 39 protein [Candidatus Omnitrophota bacterium]
MKNKHLYFLGAIFLFHLINNLYVLRIDRTPFVFDSHSYFYMSVSIYKWFLVGFRGHIDIITRPPLVMFPASLFYFLFGISRDVACFTNVIFLCVLIISMYQIGKSMGDKETGLLSVFILTTYPIVFGFSRIYMAEFPLLAMVALSLWALLRTDCLTDTRRSLLLGVICGAGLLTKMTYPAFVAGPFLYYCIHGIVIYKTKRKNIIFNSILVLCIAVSVSFFWYRPNLIQEFLRYQNDGNIPRAMSGFRLTEHPLFYLFALYNSQMWWPYYIFFMVAVAVLVVKSPAKLLFPAVTIIVPYFIFSALAIKNTRHIMAYLPAFALVTSSGLFEISKHKKAHLAVFIFIFLIGILQYLFITYSVYAKKFLEARAFAPGAYRPCPTDPSTVYEWDIHAVLNMGLWQPDDSDWKTEEITTLLLRENPQKGEAKILFVNPNPRVLFALLDHVRIQQLPLDIYKSYTAHSRGSFPKEDRKINFTFQELEEIDFLLISTFEQFTGPNTDIEDLLHALQGPPWSDCYERIATIDVPEDTSIYVYKRRRSILSFLSGRQKRQIL